MVERRFSMSNSAIHPIIFVDQEVNDEYNNTETEIVCTVPGKPFAKQRPRASKRGRFTTIYTPKQTIDYENLVKYSYYEQNGNRILDGALEVEIVGTFPVPQSASRKQAQQMLDGNIKHTKKPDCDNMAKIVLDALNNVAYHDDSQIIDLRIKKQYGSNPNVSIRIKELKGVNRSC